MDTDMDTDNEVTPSLSETHRTRTEYQLYVSHFLSMWNSRLFEFGAVLFLASIFPSTLSPMSIYALVRSAAAILLAHPIGKWIDSGNRLTVVRVSILGQRLAVAGSCGVFWIMERQIDGLNMHGVNGLFLVLVGLACVEKLCSTMNTIAVERDWVVVMTEGDEDWRRVINSKIRRIDLTCKLVGPLAISLVAMASNIIAIWAVLGMNIVSVLVEYICIERVYKSVSSLDRLSAGLDDETSPPAPLSPPSDEPPARASRLASTVSNILPISSFLFYFRHPAFLASFSLALLYLTVLSFSGQMITYLLSVGYTPLYVGIARTGSTVIELSATYAAPRLMGRIGPIRGGLWSLSWQMTCLAVGVCWYMVDMSNSWGNQVILATVLAVCVAFSRLGLWGYDLCAQIIVQDVRQTALHPVKIDLFINHRFSFLFFSRKLKLPTEDPSQQPKLHSKISLSCSLLRRRLSFPGQISSNGPCSSAWQRCICLVFYMPLSYTPGEGICSMRRLA
ncbi:hypothetical protein QQS21_008822 [Conoideocrella luteorostrata]|uniref:Solute carrier family 40 member n=1 Tax=Conoideocrella luteorostrata TaxID=1105319 RepID=A0AAJ0CKR9_9HYPO|nr:hypothetical protein QQS21_008822 [Conoideocrella luteorostrata]